MRKISDEQITFAEMEMSRDPGNLSILLSMINSILEQNPQILESASRDFALRDKNDERRGRPGMTVDQSLRVALVKQLFSLDYRSLESFIKDSWPMRAFCQMACGVPGFRSLQRNVKAVSENTWLSIHEVIVEYALKEKIESGRWIRADTTVVESNIHHPTDALLLEDCARVLIRNQHRASDHFEAIGRIRNRNRVVGGLAFAIQNCRKNDQREGHYRNLISHVEIIAEECRKTLEALKAESFGINHGINQAFINPLAHFLSLTDKVISQARRRILHGETVPAKEKVVSIFEPHTDIIAKGGRETKFGHKVILFSGKSSLILSCEILNGNPTDKTLFVPTLDKVKNITGKFPTHFSVDDGFATYDNGTEALLRGVKQLAFGGKLKHEKLSWVSSRRVQRELRRFRAGIEGLISGLKRGVGLSRCTWKNMEGFSRYVYSSVVAWNLKQIALATLGT